MDVGDLILQALLTVLIAAMVYLWFLSNLVPHGKTIFDISNSLENAEQKLSPP